MKIEVKITEKNKQEFMKRALLSNLDFEGFVRARKKNVPGFIVYFIITAYKEVFEWLEELHDESIVYEYRQTE